MLELAEPERRALHPLDQVVDRFGRPVADVRLVPGDDLCRPLADGAAEPTDLEGHRLVGEVTGDLGHPLRCELGVGVVVDLADHLLSDDRPSGLVRLGSGDGLVMPGRLGSGGRDGCSCGGVGGGSSGRW